MQLKHQLPATPCSKCAGDINHSLIVLAFSTSPELDYSSELILTFKYMVQLVPVHDEIVCVIAVMHHQHYWDVRKILIHVVVGAVT